MTAATFPTSAVGDFDFEGDPLKGDLLAYHSQEMQHHLIRWSRAFEFQAHRLIGQRRIRLGHLTVEREGKVGIELLLQLKQLPLGSIPRTRLCHDHPHPICLRIVNEKIDHAGILHATRLAWGGAGAACFVTFVGAGAIVIHSANELSTCPNLSKLGIIMKAIRVEQFGGPEVLQVTEAPDLTPASGQVLVRIHAAGINPVETYIRSGKYAKLPPLPYTPGTDGAGRIEALGAGVTGFEIGQRVYVAGSVSGTYAELCLCDARHVHPLATEVSFFEGAALGVPYATAHHALFSRAQAKPGESVLIHGATGGVGIAGLQLAKAAGMQVFATGGTETGRLLLREQGADFVFNHHELGYLDQIRENSGGGVNVVLEVLANINLGHDLTVLSRGGRVVIIGSRGPVEINPREIMAREADIRGVMLGLAAPAELEAIHRDLQAGLARGVLRPIIGRQFPLNRAPDAHEAVMAPGAHGKVVLVC